ncbi:GGDEF domain-containing protein [Aurantiacibacter marinus]|uniref:GGDEF domain-containing protein n=1 Tax=Aurantiacibacter marinus TaxID=874156 RepID=UPI00138E2A1B|nr:diguanylate cyclase [Aurantiacibacter marinus]
MRAETFTAPPAFPSASVCHAAVTASETVKDIVLDRSRWSCDTPGTLADNAQQLLLRFDLRGSAIETPGLLINSHTYREIDQFARFQLSSISGQEVITDNWLSLSDLTPTSPVWKTRVVAPPVSGDLEAVVVRIDAPTSAGVIDRFELEDTAPAAMLANADQLIAAVLCGLLIAPALFGLGYFRVLRTSFPIYHSLYCLLAVVQVAALAGLLPLMMDISRTAQIIILHMSFDLIAATSTIFAASFIERDKINALSRRMLYGVATLAVMLGLMRVTFGLTVGMPIAVAYYAGYAVFLGGLAFALIHPLRCGSRATLFLVLSYLPLILIGTARVGLALLTEFEIRFHAVMLQHFALSWQVVVSALAVADRFMLIKRDRDSARTAAILMERASERDVLTGVYNRRIITERYERLRAQGFTSLALIDLDHFKAINDTFGHTAGDKVLCAVAKALEPDSETVVIRMGGEEFALLMRGRGAFDRAEHRRRMVPAAAKAALGNDHLLTASMGLVELQADAMPDADFAALYERADRLLYEAKNTGRDRTVSERVKVFRTRKSVNRRERRVAA